MLSILGTLSIILVGLSGTFSVDSVSFVYNVLASNNVGIIYTSSVSSNVTVSNCSFSVNSSSAVVPQSLIGHVGGRITIIQSTFTNIALSVQTLIYFTGLLLIYFCVCVNFCEFIYFYFYIFFFFFIKGSISQPNADPLVLTINDTTFSEVESRGDFAAVIQSGVAKVFMNFNWMFSCCFQ
jgi:hypothetical protein